MNGVTTPEHPAATPGFDCPECGRRLAVGTPACPHCGIRLVGPLAQQLWHVDQQIAALNAESRRLRSLLLQPPGPDELVPPVAVTAGPPTTPVPAPAPTRPAWRLTGQHLLLGLAALLLLSGVAFFLLVVWSLIGLVGQALVMAVLTVSAAASAALAARKRLPAASETLGVIASGLVLLDLTAAHRLGLADLDRLDLSTYWCGAGVVGALLVLGFDRMVPRHDERGPVRRVWTYRPCAVALLTTVVWSLVPAATPDTAGGLTWSAAGLVITVASLGLARFATRLSGERGLVSLAAVLPLLSAATGLTVHLVAALDVGYDNHPALERFGAMVLLLVLPLLALVVQALPRLDDRQDLRLALRAGGLLGLVAAAGVPVLATPRVGVALIAAALGLVLLALSFTDHDAHLPRKGEVETSVGWGTLLTWTLRFAIGCLFFLLVQLIGGGFETGLDLRAFEPGAGSGPWWLPVLPAAALALPSAITAVRRDSVWSALLAHGAALAGVVLALRETESMVWAVVTLTAAVVSLAVAAAARWAALQGRHRGQEPLAALGALVHGVIAVGTAADVSSFVLSTVLVGLGALLAAYAALPGRLAVAYAGVLLLTVGLWVQLADSGVDEVEAYTWPVALGLGAIGLVQWTRDRRTPTFVTTGPALVMALFPTLLVAVGEDSPWRLVGVTLVSAVLLVVGVARGWQAPVVLSTMVLVVVAVTQGGPYVAYVPTWLLLSGAGLALLVIGLMWERSVALGRRTWTRVEAMR